MQKRKTLVMMKGGKHTSLWINTFNVTKKKLPLEKVTIFKRC